MVKNPRGPFVEDHCGHYDEVGVFACVALMAICASSRTIWVSIITASAPPCSRAVICSAKASYISVSLTSPRGSMNSPVGAYGTGYILARGLLVIWRVRRLENLAL